MNNNGSGNPFIFLPLGLIQYANFSVVAGPSGNSWNPWDMNSDTPNSIPAVWLHAAAALTMHSFSYATGKIDIYYLTRFTGHFNDLNLFKISLN